VTLAGGETGPAREADAACCSLGAAGGEEVVVIPWPLLFRQRVAHRAHSSDRYRWWVLVTVLVGLFSINVTFTILAVALPTIAHELHTTTNTLTWVITGPTLAFGVAAPVLGKAGDIWGYRRLYLLGLAGGFCCATLSALAPNAPSLIAIRTLEGLEGAATGAASMALIFQVFEPGDRVKAMGWWSLIGAGGPVIGVTLGGPLIDHFGWRALFIGQAPISLSALLVAFAILPPNQPRMQRRLDWAGAGALTVSITSLLYALNRGPEAGWTSPEVLIGFLLTPTMAMAFWLIERRSPEPLLPVRYFRRRNFVCPMGAQVFANFAYLGGFILAPLLLERVYGYSATDAGLVVIARPFAFSITAPIAGYLAVRIGERVSAIAGSAAVGASMLVFSSLSHDSALTMVIFALILSGVGLGAASPSVAASVANAVDEADLGIASATQQLMTQVGSAAGIQVMETVQTAREPSAGLLGSFSQAYLVGFAASVLAMAFALGIRRATRDERGRLTADDLAMAVPG
jgi:EmrB/QacA subfamily drug resistance transporter